MTGHTRCGCLCLRDQYRVPFDRICMHEFVCEGRPKGSAVRALDVSKRLMDFGFHPPTNYFPLIVDEALMVEPTEFETKETLDAFIAVMQDIANEARETPDRLQDGIVTLTGLPRKNTRRRGVSRRLRHGIPPAHRFSAELAKRSS